MKFQEIADLNQIFLITSDSENPDDNQTGQMVGTTTDSYEFNFRGDEAWRGGLLKTISQLNEIVVNSGEEMWGNVCYTRKPAGFDFIDLIPEQDERFKSRRRNIARIAQHIDSVFEIGVNAGHSAALWLTFNENINYYGVDICTDNYMRSCTDFLKQEFGDRFNFFVGDSRTELQTISKKINKKIDLIHIDGGHSFELASSDLLASIEISKTLQTNFILLDDTDNAPVRLAADKHIMKGLLQTETLGGSFEQLSTQLLRIL